MADVSEQATRSKGRNSILGTLISTAASALKVAASPATSSDRSGQGHGSTPEDLHTKALLFPDTLSSPESKASGGAQSLRDVRVIVAQDGSNAQPKVILFDSKVASAPGAPHHRRSHSRAIGSRAARPSPNASAQTQQDHGQALDSNTTITSLERARRPGLNSVFAIEPPPQWHYGGEPVGEMRQLLDCMFGSTPLSDRGDTTKMHVFPGGQTTTTTTTTTTTATTTSTTSRGTAPTSPVAPENSGSWGRRRSHLSNSFTPSDLGAVDFAGETNFGGAGKESGTRTLLLTRTFAVSLPDLPQLPPRDMDRLRSHEASAVKPTSSAKFPRRCKTPMYAVAITLQIPASAPAQPAVPTQLSRLVDCSAAPHTRADASDGADGSASALEASVVLDRDCQSGSVLLDAACQANIWPHSRVSGSDVDDHVDIVMQRFDMVSRVLSSLQTSVRAIVMTMLQKTALDTLNAQSPRAPVLARAANEPGRPMPDAGGARTKSPQVVLVQLPAGALATNQSIRQEADRSSTRILASLRIPMVVTGQKRWGSWRDEARWAEQHLGRKEQSFFFPRLLTAFLGNHHEWLYELGLSDPGRQRPGRRGTARAAKDCAIPTRTVIVSSNKAASRRLIYLLSTFLPAFSRSACVPAAAGPGGGSGSSTALLRRQFVVGSRPIDAAADQHDAVHGPLAPEQGRVIDTGAKRLPAGCDEVQRPEETQASSRQRPAHLSSTQVTALPIPTKNAGIRKGSAATTVATVTPATTAAAFSATSALAASGSCLEAHPECGGSLASMNLIHTLQRNESTENSQTSTDSQAGSRWGSLVSSLWGARRGSSTDDTEFSVAPEDDAAPISPSRDQLDRDVRRGRLAQMVAEVETSKSPGDVAVRVGGQRAGQPDGAEPPSRFDDRVDKSTVGYEVGVSRPWPETPYVDSLLKLSVDGNDGVVDVDFQVPSFLSSSFGSSAWSPSTSGFTSAASFEEGSPGQGLSPLGVFSGLQPRPTLNVAGWLNRYHPDFALQAASSYPGLQDDIKRSMQEEHTPNRPVPAGARGRMHQEWRTVCCTVVADMETFTVKRLRLLRRPKATSGPKPYADGSSAVFQPPLTLLPSERLQSVSQTDFDAIPFDDMFDEEPVSDIDSALIDAVEHVISPTASDESNRSMPMTRSRSHESDAPKQSVGSIDRAEDAISANDCEDVIREALEAVVKDVIRQVGVDEPEDTPENMRDPQGAMLKPRRPMQGSESSLRDGIRKWLSDGDVIL